MPRSTKSKALVVVGLLWGVLWLLRAAVEVTQEDWAWAAYSAVLGLGGLAWLPALRRGRDGA